jgi:hypothetical protein
VTRGRIIAIVILVVALIGGGIFGWMQFGDRLTQGNQTQGQPRAASQGPARPPVQIASGDATPMAERVATIAFLNKRNGETRDLEMKPGESRRVGDAIVRLSACERTAPWEPVPETGAFVQLLVQDRETRSSDPVWKRVFSGWVFKESPSLNVVEHPIYDVWVKNCAMEFPGEEAPVESQSAPASRPAAAPPVNAENPATSPESAPAPATPSTDAE